MQFRKIYKRSKEKTMSSRNFLKKYLADNYALLLKTHAFHWNVSGTRFYDLHLMFEEQYTDLFEAVDIIAERIRALGEYAPGGMITYTDMTSVEDPEENIDANDMIRALIFDHKKLRDDARGSVKFFAQAGDDATADILISRIQRHEKNIWMMDSILDDKPREVQQAKNSERNALKVLEKTVLQDAAPLRKQRARREG